MSDKKSSVVSATQNDPSHLQESKSLDGVPQRAQWNSKAEFVLSCISLSVGLGNVWRFPYLAYAYGGGAFLLPYLVVLFLCGKPMYFLECAIGQYHQEGPVTIWKKVSPIGKGIGIAQMLIQSMTAMSYMLIMGWTMYYFWTTLIAALKGEEVPWAGHFCDSEWAHKATCISVHKSNDDISSEIPVMGFFGSDTVHESVKVSSAQQYYDRVIIMKYDKNGTERYNLAKLGGVNWILLANLAGSWLLIFFALVKGISSAGKVVYITSTLPFIVLLILLGRGASLPNAVEGIKYFLVPQFDKLLDVQTWRNAAEQMFYSLSVAFGSLVMLGSYNKRSNNCYQYVTAAFGYGSYPCQGRDAMIVSVVDTMTSVTAGLAMFSVLGFMAGELDVGVDKVAQSGSGLAFVTFPEALNQMPLPHLWAIMFFLMLYTLGLGSEIATLETVLTVIYDQWPFLRTKKPLVCGLACFSCFVIGFPFALQGGVDLFDVFDSYAGGFSVLFPAVMELIIVMWVYGMSRFVNDLNNMLGKRVSIYWRSTWGFLAPLSLLFILIITFIDYTPLNHGGQLPDFADGLGWGLALVSIIQIPIWAGIAIYQAKGNTIYEKFHESCWPAEIMIPKPVDFMELTDAEKMQVRDLENRQRTERYGVFNVAFDNHDENRL